MTSKQTGSKAPIGDGYWDRREGQSSWWLRREGESIEQQNKRWNHAIFMGFDPDDPDAVLD
ncbi:MAG: hypothetical protein AAF940_03735 [Pseudomonadota bacterium]